MINRHMYDLGAEPSAIRELFAYGMARKAQIGDENVFDFSIGNPSVPAPGKVRETIIRLMDEDPTALHGYTPAPGDPAVRSAVADHIRRNYGIDARPEQVYLTAGAAAGLAIAIAAITVPGDQVIVPSPFFPEYRTWVEQSGCELVEVPCAQPSFQLDVDAIAAAITPSTSAVIVNSPNNPVGSVYSRENLLFVLEEPFAARRENRLHLRFGSDGQCARDFACHSRSRPRSRIHLRAGAVPARIGGVHRLACGCGGVSRQSRDPHQRLGRAGL